jgi:ATP phosphoribosyltransferase
MSEPLILALPSKGRLMEAAEAYFLEAGLEIQRHGGMRRYQGAIKGMEGVEVRFLSAGEIAAGLIDGDIHLGITGRDLLHEKTPQPDDCVAPLSALNFGHADVIVAVPEAWLDVETMADLAEVSAEIRQESGRVLRVATKFINITRAWFARQGITDYRIVESLGATEGAPAAGTAEVIVDITSTGATLVANHLKILKDGVILNSEAFLCGALDADWSVRSLGLAEKILGRLAARDRAKTMMEVRLDVSAAKSGVLKEIVAACGAQLTSGDWPQGDERELVLHVPKVDFHDLAAKLRGAGCKSITARELEFIYGANNSLFETLEMERDQAAGRAS